MFRRCENRCGRLFESQHPADFFCSPECRAERHAALKRTPCSEETRPPVASSTPPTLAPQTMSMSEAYLLFAERTAGLPDNLGNSVLALETRRRVLETRRRPDLSPVRPSR